MLVLVLVMIRSGAVPTYLKGIRTRPACRTTGRLARLAPEGGHNQIITPTGGVALAAAFLAAAALAVVAHEEGGPHAVHGDHGGAHQSRAHVKHRRKEGVGGGSPAMREGMGAGGSGSPNNGSCGFDRVLVISLKNAAAKRASVRRCRLTSG